MVVEGIEVCDLLLIVWINWIVVSREYKVCWKDAEGLLLDLVTVPHEPSANDQKASSS